MKICHYNDHEAGVVQDDRVYPIGQTLVGAGHLRQTCDRFFHVAPFQNHQIRQFVDQDQDVRKWL